MQDEAGGEAEVVLRAAEEAGAHVVGLRSPGNSPHKAIVHTAAERRGKRSVRNGQSASIPLGAGPAEQSVNKRFEFPQAHGNSRAK